MQEEKCAVTDDLLVDDQPLTRRIITKIIIIRADCGLVDVKECKEVDKEMRLNPIRGTDADRTSLSTGHGVLLQSLSHHSLPRPLLPQLLHMQKRR